MCFHLEMLSVSIQFHSMLSNSFDSNSWNSSIANKLKNWAMRKLTTDDWLIDGNFSWSAVIIQGNFRLFELDTVWFLQSLLLLLKTTLDIYWITIFSIAIFLFTKLCYLSYIFAYCGNFFSTSPNDSHFVLHDFIRKKQTKKTIEKQSIFFLHLNNQTKTVLFFKKYQSQHVCIHVEAVKKTTTTKSL